MMPTISRQTAIRKHYPIGDYFIQTVLIPDRFTKKEASSWLIAHGLRHDYHRMTTNFHRYMQHNPVERSTYITKKGPDGVELVYQRFT